MKEPMPRTPRPKSKLEFAGEVIGNFLVVNLIAFGALVLQPQPFQGATASAHLDPSTGKPVLMELQGCKVLPPDNSQE